jgi:hypothetical protein
MSLEIDAEVMNSTYIDEDQRPEYIHVHGGKNIQRIHWRNTIMKNANIHPNAPSPLKLMVDQEHWVWRDKTDVGHV